VAGRNPLQFALSDALTAVPHSLVPSRSERVPPGESGKASKIAVGRAQRQAMLDRERGEMGIGDKIPVHTG